MDADTADTADDAPWYEVAFGALYPVLYSHRDDASAADEVAAVAAALGLDSSDRVLDLGCGGGRHLRALERRGHFVVGVDLSRDLLSRAKSENDARLVRGDMRRVPLRDASFDGVLSLFSSFGYFPSDDEDARVLDEVFRLLVPGGRYFLDFLDSDWVRAHLVPRSERRQAGFRIVETRRIEDERVKKVVQIQSEDGVDAFGYEESVRLYGRDELMSAVERAGLRVTGVQGGFDGRAAGSGDRLQVLAEKPS